MNKVWATLLTNESYLPGIVVFNDSLVQSGSKYPLVALITSGLSDMALNVLKEHSIATRKIELLLPPDSNQGSLDAHDARFADTWTKLRVFELTEYSRVVLVDSDMLVRRNMDELMDLDLQLPSGETSVAAVHACTCNPRKLAHYPQDWVPENCAHTLSTSAVALQPAQFSKDTHHLINSGLVVLEPSESDFAAIVNVLHTDPIVQTFKFPDQDLLAYVFKGRFKPLPYVYNALKTLRSCHDNLWDDEDVKNVHYIIDKPWKKRVDRNDPDHPNAVTHSWWWDAYDALASRFAKTELWRPVAANVDHTHFSIEPVSQVDPSRTQAALKSGGGDSIVDTTTMLISPAGAT